MSSDLSAGDPLDFAKSRVDLQAVGYEHDGTISTYVIDDGIVISPLQGPVGTPPVTLRVFSPYTVRKTTGSAVKKNAPPLIPPPADTQTGHIFLNGNISVPAPSFSGTRQLVFGVQFEYNFLVPQHIKETGKILFDAHPYLSGVDVLGNMPPNVNPAFEQSADNIGMGYMWNPFTGAFFDLSKQTTSRMLG